MTEKFQAITDLLSWDANYEHKNGPFTLFMDLIGYSDELYGSAQFDLDKHHLGYLELDYLADALKVYAEIGEDAHKFVTNLLNQEATK